MVKEYKSFFKEVSGNEGNKCHYNTRLDTYGCGCYHNCKYCYAKSLLNFRKLWDADNPAVADIRKIRKRIEKIPNGAIVRLGGMTDCFQPIEGKYGVTYDTIKALNDNGIGYLIVTKSPMVATEKYLGVMDRGLAHIQVSVTTTDDKISKDMERAAAASERMAAVERLQSRGFDTTLRLSPFVPQLFDFDIVNSVKCDKVLVEFLRVNNWIKQWFPISYSDYTLKQSNYLHLPLEKKVEALSKITGFNELSVCEDVTEHWKYWHDNVNANPEDCCNLKK